MKSRTLVLCAVGLTTTVAVAITAPPSGQDRFSTTASDPVTKGPVTPPVLTGKNTGRNTQPPGKTAQKTTLSAAPEGVGNVFTFCSNDVPRPLFDNTTTLSTITVSGVAGEVIDVDLHLDVTHDCTGALSFDLTSPDGTTATILEWCGAGGILCSGGCFPGFVGTIIDDSAPTNLAAGAPPYTGTFNALHATALPLSTFNGGSAGGTWTLAVRDEDGFGDSGAILGWCLAITVAPNFPRVEVCSSDVGQAIPDNNPAGATSTLAFPFNGTVADVDLEFDITHGCIAALEIVLIAPDGTAVKLIDSYVAGGILTGLGCPSAFTGTILDDIAPTNLAAGAPPYTGTFNNAHVTAQPLSTFVGTAAKGTWRLVVRDEDGAGDVGNIHGWCLRVAVLPDTCAADLNGDGVVNVLDLLLMLGAWGSC